VPYWYIDTGFAALLILLAVVDEGLGAVLFGIQPEVMGEFRAGFAALLTLLAVVDEGHGASFFGIQPEIMADFRAWTSWRTVVVGRPI
jgi:hypothetical protein